ncbi:MAG: SDR family NAD(P)-dependent oxidoreductase [Propionibacteriaceae bacterium]|jgi:short-subunit dehydrogenase|nr:SDR family NAD(P)-dependent oxidoreductase [Propionibacteriaceae bacterium]
MPTALITGGTSGIGAAFARALAADGFDLVLVARDIERLAESASGLEARYNIDVETLPADLSQREEIDKVASRVEDEDHPIEILVNNAGFGLHSDLLKRDYEIDVKAFDVMCLAVFVLGAAAGRAMKARGHGHIVNISSLASWIAQGNYSPIKAYVRSYSEGLANQLYQTGVGVTAVCPGWVRTEFHERAGIRTSKIPNFIWVDADRMVREALRDVRRGKVISVPTKRWKVAAFLAAHAPRGAVRWASRLLMKSRA